MDLFPALTPIAKPLPTGHVRSYISPGDLGTAQTILEMQKAVGTGKRDFRVRVLVGRLLQGCTHKDFYCYAERIFNFCRDKIIYAYDPNGVELIEMPWKVLEAGIADCDSICVLFCSMCESIGLPCEFVTIKGDPKRPSEYSHVYCRVRVPPGRWIAADATMKQSFGWEPPARFFKKTWPASLDENETSAEIMSVNGKLRMGGLGEPTREECDCVNGVFRNGQCSVPKRAYFPQSKWQNSRCEILSNNPPVDYRGSKVFTSDGDEFVWDSQLKRYSQVKSHPYETRKGPPAGWAIPAILILGAMWMISRR